MDSTVIRRTLFVSLVVLLLAKDSNFTSISDPEMGSGEIVEDVIIPELPQEHIDALIQNPYFGNPRDQMSTTPILNDLQQTSDTNTSDPGHAHPDTSRDDFPDTSRGHSPAPVETIDHSSISSHQSIPIWNGADDLPTGETSLSDTNAESLHQVEESNSITDSDSSAKDSENMDPRHLESSEPRRLSSGAIIGVVVGILSVITVVVIIILVRVLLNKRQKKKHLKDLELGNENGMAMVSSNDFRLSQDEQMRNCKL
jgi:hypothetical protein